MNQRKPSRSKSKNQHDEVRGTMTKERMAYGQKIYHSIYDFSDATGFETSQLSRLCIKWKMTPAKWFKRVKGHPRIKWKLRSSLTYVSGNAETTPWYEWPMYKSRFED